jgi:hypothetical protein
MLKTLIFAGALAALLPAAVQAQPRPWPSYGQGYYQGDQGYYQSGRGYYRGDRYDDDDDRRGPRDWNRGYGYPGAPYVQGHPAYDEYGPDPNGLRAPDGHRIKCKLMDQWDDYAGQYVRRRNCW